MWCGIPRTGGQKAQEDNDGKEEKGQKERRRKATRRNECGNMKCEEKQEERKRMKRKMSSKRRSGEAGFGLTLEQGCIIHIRRILNDVLSNLKHTYKT